MTTEVAPANTDGEKYPELRSMVQTLRSKVVLDDSMGQTDTDEFVMSIMEGILSAESPEDVFAAQDSGLIAGKDFTGRPFMLRGDGITYRKAQDGFVEQGGFPIYAVLNVIEIATQEEIALTCGAKTFMACLYALDILRGYFDTDRGCPEEGRALVIVGKAVAGGNTYLQLKPVRLPEAPRQRGKQSK